MTTVLAYLDGGSISLLIAAIGGGVAGLRVFGLGIFRSIIRWLRRSSQSTDAE